MDVVVHYTMFKENIMGEKFTLFWRGPLSQWYKSHFYEDGIHYFCMEQYMMAKKAELFGDMKMKRLIMESSSPKEIKDFGRMVKPFDKQKWDAVARDIVFQGNYLKFTQDGELKKKLMETDGTTCVEASPYDKIWGIGLAENGAGCQSRSTWKGLNWLGETITKVREKIKYEDTERICK